MHVNGNFIVKDSWRLRGIDDELPWLQVSYGFFIKTNPTTRALTQNPYNMFL